MYSIRILSVFGSCRWNWVRHI